MSRMDMSDFPPIPYQVEGETDFFRAMRYWDQVCKDAKRIEELEAKNTVLKTASAEVGKQAIERLAELEAENKELREDLNIANLRLKAALGQKRGDFDINDPGH